MELSFRHVLKWFNNKEELNSFDYSKIYRDLGIPKTLNYPTTTLGRMIDQTAKRFKTAPAVTYNGLTLTYEELLEKVNRLAGGLNKLGISRGQKVLVTLPNCPEYIITFLAVQKLGGIIINAGPLMGLDDLTKIIELTNPKIIVSLDLQGSKLESLLNESKELKWIWVSLKDYQSTFKKIAYNIKLKQSKSRLPSTTHQISLNELIEVSPSRPPIEDSSPTDTAILQPTGGTTGILKVAELTHINILSNAVQMSTWAKLRQGQEKVFAVLPMFHVYGLSTCLVASIFNGAHILPVPKFELEETINTIIKYKPSVLPLVPAIFDAILIELENNELLRNQFVDAVKNTVIISGAAALSYSTFEKFQQITGENIIQGFGMTEASPVTHVNPINKPKVGSIGIPVPDTDAKIVSIDDKTKELGNNEAGELVVSGPQVMKGYFKNEDATEGMLQVDSSGKKWLFTGDIAVRDDDGYYKIVDRKKEMINKGGMKVWPAKIEKVIMQHADVKDVAVYGKIDDKYGEIVVATVSLKTIEFKDEIKDELLELCKNHLSKYEIPSSINIVENLPRNGLGKMLKYQLKSKPGE